MEAEVKVKLSPKQVERIDSEIAKDSILFKDREDFINTSIECYIRFLDRVSAKELLRHFGKTKTIRDNPEKAIKDLKKKQKVEK